MGEKADRCRCNRCTCVNCAGENIKLVDNLFCSIECKTDYWNWLNKERKVK